MLHFGESDRPHTEKGLDQLVDVCGFERDVGRVGSAAEAERGQLIAFARDVVAQRKRATNSSLYRGLERSARRVDLRGQGKVEADELLVDGRRTTRFLMFLAQAPQNLSELLFGEMNEEGGFKREIGPNSKHIDE
ncbi:hypothetical protein [Hyphomicrobium zavarzinii]|uniref:hypothetical protein n=1 Tax=Hyphomicrobium zavarzinii TaxID=48292 RepID=UPI0012EC1473|nr:hypothetical protein [Hyphomicrobium zavarzinii]